MLEADKLSAAYGKSRIIHDVSFRIAHAEKCCLIGRNGVGKTTLLKSLIGLLPFTQGSLLFEGRDVTADKPFIRSRIGMAYVPQGREIIPMLTVRENLELGALAKYAKETARLMEEVLDYFPALRSHLDRKGGVLSGGQQQQLAIGRALMTRPKVLFLDEPSEGIQPNVVAEISEILNRVNREKQLAILIVEQNLDFAFRISDKYYVMEKGSIAASGIVNESAKEAVKPYLTL